MAEHFVAAALNPLARCNGYLPIVGKVGSYSCGQRAICPLYRDVLKDGYFLFVPPLGHSAVVGCDAFRLASQWVTCAGGEWIVSFEDPGGSLSISVRSPTAQAAVLAAWWHMIDVYKDQPECFSGDPKEMVQYRRYRLREA